MMKWKGRENQVINTEGVAELGNWPLPHPSATWFNETLGAAQGTGDSLMASGYSHTFKATPHGSLTDYKEMKSNVVEKRGRDHPHQMIKVNIIRSAANHQAYASWHHSLRTYHHFWRFPPRMSTLNLIMRKLQSDKPKWGNLGKKTPLCNIKKFQYNKRQRKTKKSLNI